MKSYSEGEDSSTDCNRDGYVKRGGDKNCSDGTQFQDKKENLGGQRRLNSVPVGSKHQETSWVEKNCVVEKKKCCKKHAIGLEE